MSPVIVGVPIRETPNWAVLERALFARLDWSWREFERRFCLPDGRVRYSGTMEGRDGVDDFYESFFNWPTLYRLGGSDDLLASSKHHWEGVTRQMAEYGFVKDEYELGYDWFHQAESLGLFLGICASDPADVNFRKRAERFAGFYLPGFGNYDSSKRMIVAPHTGAGGPRWGVGEPWDRYSADQPGMEIYGLPLMDLQGIHTWDDLRRPGAPETMGQAMRQRMGVGDTAINLIATTLAANAWLYDHDSKYSDWLLDYIDAWRQRAANNGGIVPDNVGPSGTVGELHDGAWYGALYGWTWPHGAHCIVPALLVAGLNAGIVSGNLANLDMARSTLDALLAMGEVRSDIRHQGSLGVGMADQLGAGDGTKELLIPYRRGPQGWFDWHPVQIEWLEWPLWMSGTREDLERLERVHEASQTDWEAVRWFRNKEEQGHLAPWISWLSDNNPDYPAEALNMALGQVERRLSLMAAAPDEPADLDIHFWQRLNPVVTEVLTQLTTGAPAPIYYGGLAVARVVYGDADVGRPGLPPDVAALVSGGVMNSGSDVQVELINLGSHERRVVVQAGAFAEDQITEATYLAGDNSYPGDQHAYDVPQLVEQRHKIRLDDSRLVVSLPPLSRQTLNLTVSRRAYAAKYTNLWRSNEHQPNLVR